MEVVASLFQGRTADAQCGLFTYKSVPVIFEPPCIYVLLFISVAWGGVGNSGSARCLTCNGNTAWMNPSASIHFTNASPKKYVSLIFGDLFQLIR